MSAPRILLGVCGGIAAYKAAEIARALAKEGCAVQAVLTRRAEEFVTPLTLATLTGREVARSEFGGDEGRPASPAIGHIELARWADALLVAPATANEIARFAHGLGDDLLTTVYLAFNGPVVVAPAMNPKMWDHPETRANVLALGRRGVAIVEPEEGVMACGDEGAGRLARVESIVAEALRAARRGTRLAGVKVLVSAGPTYEPLDPVRFLGNRSSGKMGFAVAAAARARGAEVTLVAGPVDLPTPWGVSRVDVTTAAEMHAAVRAAAADAGVVVMSAAVADHRPEAIEDDKIHRPGEPYAVRLVPNADILAELVRDRRPGQVVVGFAAETGPLALERGQAKLARKGCDLLVVNDVTAEGAGFGVDTNIVTLLAPGAAPEALPRMAKRAVAERLLDRIDALRPGGGHP